MKALRVAILLTLVPAIILGQEAGGETDKPEEPEWKQFWGTRLLMNLLGYATIFVPGFLIIRHLRNIKYNETAGTGEDGTSGIFAFFTIYFLIISIDQLCQ